LEKIKQLNLVASLVTAQHFDRALIEQRECRRLLGSSIIRETIDLRTWLLKKAAVILEHFPIRLTCLGLPNRLVSASSATLAEEASRDGQSDLG
jgi:hypothetical protein